MTSEFGKRLASLLKARGMTQKQLAQRLGMSEITISRYVTGERQPSAEAVTNIARELGTTGDYLMGTQNAKAAGLLSSDDSDKIKDILDGRNDD